MEGCTFTPQLHKPPRHVRPRYPRAHAEDGTGEGGADREEPLASHLVMLEAALDARNIVRPHAPAAAAAAATPAAATPTAAAAAAAAATPTAATPAAAAAAAAAQQQQLKALLRVPTSSETRLSSRHTAAGMPAELTALSVHDKLQLLENYLEQVRALPTATDPQPGRRPSP